MPFLHVGRRVLTVLAALAVLAACSEATPRPDVADPVGPTTPGVRLAWSKTVATSTRPFAVVGETKVQPRMAPGIGEHTRGVLEELGCSPAEFEALLAD